MFKWFRKETDVKTLEKELASLATKVNKHEASLSQVRSNARRYKGAVTLYSVLFYSIYFAIWAAFLVRNQGDKRKLMYESLPILVGPFIIYSLRTVLSSYYERRISNEESQLDALKTQQKDKIEEFKTKTDFYTTKSLIDRYSSSEASAQSSPETKQKTPSGTPVGLKKAQPNLHQQYLQQQVNASPRISPQSQVTPQRAPQSLVGTVPTPASLSGTPQHRVSQAPPKIAEFAPNADAHQVSGSRHWYDRMLDIIVGEDEGSDKSRYRLEQTIREREEKITNLELEVIKLKQMVAGDKPSKDEHEVTKVEASEANISEQQGTTALKKKPLQTRKSQRRAKKSSEELDDDDDDE